MTTSFVLQAMNVFLDVEFPRMGFHLEDLKEIRNRMDSVESFRAYVSGMPGGKAASTSWQANLQKSSMMLLKMMEDRPALHPSR